jgi:hypothetical protein
MEARGSSEVTTAWRAVTLDKLGIDHRSRKENPRDKRENLG